MKKTFLCSLLYLLSFLAIKQSNAQPIDSMLQVYAEKLPNQKIYVQFDKDIYRAGESIWFKAYLFEGFAPSLSSKNFYAELLDNAGNVLQRKVYPVVESSAAGNFDLPANVNGNLFHFRAYTTTILNVDSSFIYKKDIVITAKDGGIIKQPIAKVVNTKTITFFPEGGDLVNSLESVVAFKANDSYGMPVKVSGTVVNTAGETVATFTTLHDGMGSFKLEPASGNTYTAKWTTEDGEQHETMLPAAKNSGVVLHVDNIGNRKIFVIKRTMADESLSMVRVIGQIGQQVVYKARVPLTSPANSGSIPVKDMPDGILTITVFNEQYQPLAERIVLINNHNHLLDVDLNTLETSLDKRGKNVLELSVPDTNLTNLSVSITDAGLSNAVNKDNIVSRMLVTGDLKGYVHQPAYYFSNTSDSLVKQLDLVMMTHGWRRYNWQDIVMQRKPILKYPADNFLSITAKVFGITPYTTIKPDEELLAILQTKDSTKHMLLLPKTGRDAFSISGLSFFDTAKIYYQFQKNRSLSSTLSIGFDNGLYKGFKKVKIDSLQGFTALLDSNLLNRNKAYAQEVIRYGTEWTKGNVLANVLVKTRKKSRAEELDDQYVSGMFKGGDAYSFDLLSDPSASSAMNIFTYLQGRVAGLQINDATGTPSVTWRNSTTTLFLDEMQVEPDQIATLNVNDIAYVKVFRPPFFGASLGGSGGAIAIYTKKGNDYTGSSVGKGLEMNTIVGYAPFKQFYSPNYADKTQDDSQPDYRTTLYWNPFVFMDAGRQKVKVEFYNNDISKSYRVIVEGVSETGKLVRIEKVVQ